MIINIKDLEIDRVQEFSIDEDFEDLKAHAQGEVEASMNGDIIEITGEIEAELECECDRCLKTYTENFIINIDEKFYKESFIPENTKEYEIKHSNFAEELYGREEIDLRDLIYQSIILNVPNKKLCDINCIGTDEVQRCLKDDENTVRIEIPLKKNDKNK
ncbi:MAG: DUF177 domain-containing protein [Candidatus Gastranaerophilales bacterium]|nr:DUF177 domain-containing protein [Candidatus Gastranaerophilales bacterium]